MRKMIGLLAVLAVLAGAVLALAVVLLRSKKYAALNTSAEDTYR